jgi:hypothetical protein
MTIEIPHVHEHAIDNPGHLRPFASLFAYLAMTSRTVVVGRGRREHDHPVAGGHLAVRETPVGPDLAICFLEAECAREPVECGDAVLVRNHRDNRRRGNALRRLAPRPALATDGRLPASGLSLSRGDRFPRCGPALPGRGGFLPS